MAGGRQREFDKAQALESAMHVFWQKGYVGASLTDLTGAMGINKPSMYAAFGNKEKLFVQALDHYLTVRATPQMQHLTEPGLPLKRRLYNYVASVVKGQCEGERPLGCFITLCVSEAANDSLPEAAEASIAKAKHMGGAVLTDWFESEKQQGHLSQSFDCELNASLIMTFMHGTASMARGGKTFAQLEPLIGLVLANVVDEG